MGLSDTVSEWLKQGYSLDYVRKYLKGYGYSDSEIESALKQSSFQPSVVKHQHSFSGSAIIFVFLMILVSTGIVFGVLKLTETTEALLDLELTPEQTTLNPGGEVKFTLRILNLGGKERFDVFMYYEVVDREGTVYESSEETFALSTSSSRDKSISAPEEPGTYALKAVAEYERKRATASFSFRVEEKEEEVDVSQEIRNAEELSRTLPGEAEGKCLELGEARDDCLTLVVKNSRRPEFCKNIESDETRDNCYMSFIVEGQNNLCTEVVLDSSVDYCNRIKDVQILSAYYGSES